MSGVRILVGTRKGAFVLTSDGARKRWFQDPYGGSGCQLTLRFSADSLPRLLTISY